MKAKKKAEPEPYLTISQTKPTTYNGMGTNGVGGSISLSGRESLVLKLYEQWKSS